MADASQEPKRYPDAAALAPDAASTRAARRRRRMLRQAIYGGLVLCAFVALGWYLTSDSFREVIRHRLIAQIEDATGGQVEIGSVEWNLAHLRMGVDSLTIHGLEAPTDAPLVQVNRIDASIRIISLLGRQFSFKTLAFDRPSLNLIVYPDGRTNQPTPRHHASSAQPTLGLLFDIAIRNLIVKNGLLTINEQRMPLDFNASDVSAALRYEASPELYAGKVTIGKFDTSYKGYRPFSSTGQFDFRLYRNALEIKSAQITSERSNLSFSGKLTNFSQPSLDVNYEVKLDLRQAGAVVRDVEWQSGVATLRGSVSYAAAHFASAGRLQVNDAAWNTPNIHVSGLSGTANYSLDPYRLGVNRIVATALGGSVTGDFSVSDWNAPLRPHVEFAAHGSLSHAMEAREQYAKGKFDLRNLQLEKIASLFNSRALPLIDLHASGVAGGTAELSWRGAPQFAELHLDLNAIPTLNAGAAELPLAAHVAGTYAFHARSMDLEQAELQTANSHITATGTLGADRLNLGLGATTTRLQEVQPLLSANGAGNLPVQLAGEGSFQGSLGGTFAMPTMSGHLKLADFSTVLRPAREKVAHTQLVQSLHQKGLPAAAPARPQAVLSPIHFHWDSFDGYISYASDAASVRSGVLRTGTARFEFNGNTTLIRGAFTDTSVFHAAAQIRNARLRDAQALLGFSYPVTGTLNMELELSGTAPDPHGSGKLSIANGTAFGEPLQSFSTELAFSGHEARLFNARAVSDSAKGEGSASINVTTEQLRFDLHASGVDLLRFPLLQTAKVKLTGVGDFTVQGSGMLGAPSVQAHARITNISLGGKREGDLLIDGTTVGDELKLSATSNFVTATLGATGQVRLRGDLSSDITAKFGNVDLQPFLVGIARGHSSIDGSLHVTGPLLHPAQLNARLEIPRYESQVEAISLRNAGPIVASYSDGTARLESFRLVGDATDLTSSGTMRLTGARELNLRADGRLNLKLLQSFDPDILSYGQTSIGVRVGGTVRDPVLRGRVTIEHAGISYVDLPNGLTDLNGSLVFNEDRLQVEKLTAHTGGGDLAIGGFISYSRNLNFNLTATGKDVRIRYPEGVSANGDADLRLAGTLSNATLSGQVTVNKFGLNPRFDFAYYLTRSQQAVITPNAESPLNHLHFDVRVVSAPELQVETSLARITGNVDLRLRGSALRPVVLGRISIVEGNITFNGTKYRLDRGDILFSNPSKIEPILDLEASARVSNYDISIGLHGTTDKLNTSYRSDPPLPTADVFALLAFGRTTDRAYSTTESTNFTQTASNAVLGSALNAAVGSRVQKLFGASRIKIDPQVGGPENNPNARITVEQQVSGDLTLTYITNLAQSAQQVIQFQYNVNRNVSIVGVRDEYGVVGFEIQLRQRKR